MTPVSKGRQGLGAADQFAKCTTGGAHVLHRRSFNHYPQQKLLLFLLQSFCPVMKRRMLITPAQEAPTGWTASPLDLQTLLTLRRRPPEGEWRQR